MVVGYHIIMPVETRRSGVIVGCEDSARLATPLCFMQIQIHLPRSVTKPLAMVIFAAAATLWDVKVFPALTACRYDKNQAHHHWPGFSDRIDGVDAEPFI
jgi:hypothetical protein